MQRIHLRAVTDANWREALELAVLPEQQRFVSEYAPIAALALAKAYILPGGIIWTPYAIYADDMMVGFFMLAYEPDTSDQYWLFHFFIDHRSQGRGYGKRALTLLIDLVREQHPQSQAFQLVVHPENVRAQHLYTGAGFRPMGTEFLGEPVYRLALR